MFETTKNLDVKKSFKFRSQFKAKGAPAQWETWIYSMSPWCRNRLEVYFLKFGLSL